jgi:hypothetical protein
MAHFAQVIDNKVVKVIVAEQEYIDTIKNTNEGEWIQTSYNTYMNTHRNGGTPLRGNYAGFNYTYDRINDVFYEPQPFPSWTLNTSTWGWEAPIAMPTNGKHTWDETTTSWIEIENV